MFGNPRVLDHPFVSALARCLWEQPGFKAFLKQDPDRFKRACVVGLLLEFFVGPKSADGNFLPGLTEERIDQSVGAPGFGRALGQSGLLSRETHPREGMMAYHLESWFDLETAALLRALCVWWAEQPGTAMQAAESPAQSKKAPKEMAHPMFDEFWELYPNGSRKVGRKQCKEKYDRIVKDRAPHEEVIEGLKRWLASDDWAKEGGKYVPKPEVWLNRECWEATPEPASKQPQREQPSVTEDDVLRKRKEQQDRLASKRAGLNGDHSPEE